MKPEAAGLALMLPDKTTLFLKRAEGHDFPGTWSFPGGMLEPNEPPEIGAIRETREETNWIAPEEAEKPKLVHSGRFATFKQRINSQFIPTLDDENIAWAWAPIDAPPEPLHPGLKETLPMIAKDEAMATAPNAGMPMLAAWKKKAEDSLRGGQDMNPEDWRGLVGGLLEFFAEEAAEPEHAAKDANRTEKETAEGKLSEKDKSQIGRVGSEHREEMPGHAFLMPASRKYPVKEKRDGDWAYNRKLLLAAAREARMHGKDVIAERADAIRKREFGDAKQAEDAEPKTLYVNRKLKNAADVIAWAHAAGFKKTLPETDIHVTIAFSRTPIDWTKVGSDDYYAPNSKAVADITVPEGGMRMLERFGDAKDAVVLLFSSSRLSWRHEAIRSAGASWDWPEYQPHITITYDAGDINVAEIEPYKGKLEFGPEEFAEVDDNWKEKVTARLAGDENGDAVKVDAEHDGPWMSVMSKDGSTMYRNRNVPAQAEINGKTVNVDERLKAHETEEWEALQILLEAFKEERGREPNEDERRLIYLMAHHGAGVPAERELVAKQDGDGGKAWNAWCRGIEAKIEKGPFTNEPDDADVKPVPHTHGDLEVAEDVALDSNPGLALDRESVRSFDRDGRMRVATAHISKACVNPYRGEEIPNWQELGLDPNKVYNLYRDPEELRRAAPTFNGIQILQRHTPVSDDDHKPWDIIGTTGTDAKFDDPYLDNSLYFWTRDGIRDIETERKKELSAGYHYRASMVPGEVMIDGERVRFDGSMCDIEANHIAVVVAGRVGPDAVVGDSIEDLQWALIERELLATAA